MGPDRFGIDGSEDQLATVMGTLRRRVLTPDVIATKLETRGFHDKGPQAREILETVGESFLTGLGDATETGSPAATDQRLGALPTRYQGFAYEGAAMGFTLLDGLLPGSRRTAAFLRGPGDAHVYMAYVGIGWAMARLPRPLWPDIHGLDPLLRWLAHDGYGFHQAYFHTDKYVHRQVRDARAARRTGDGAYALRAADQGIGRALWFIGGTDVDQVVRLVERFPAARRSDLYAGVGLASTYAGGADEGELHRLRDRVGEHRGALAQGSAFAAETRLRAGLGTPHTELGTAVLCGTDAEQAARLCSDLRPDTTGPEPDAARPRYEVWRTALSQALVPRGGGVS